MYAPKPDIGLPTLEIPEDGDGALGDGIVQGPAPPPINSKQRTSFNVVSHEH